MSSFDEKKTLSSSPLKYFLDNNHVEKKKSSKQELISPSPRTRFGKFDINDYKIDNPSIYTEGTIDTRNDSIVMLIPPKNILLEFILKKYVRSPIMSLNIENNKLSSGNKSIKFLIEKDKQTKDRIIKVFKENIEKNQNIFNVGGSIYVADGFVMLQLCGFEDGKDFKGFKHYVKRYIEKHGIKRSGEIYIPFNQFEQSVAVAEFIEKLKSNEREELTKRNKALEEIKYITYSDLHAFDYEQYMEEQKNKMTKQVYVREDSESLCFILSQIYDKDGIDFEFNPETMSYRCSRSNYGKFLVNLKRIEGFNSKVVCLVGSCVAFGISFVEEKGKDLHTSISRLILAQQIALDSSISEANFLKLPIRAQEKLYKSTFPFCSVEIGDDKEIHFKKMNWLPSAYDLVPIEFRKYTIHEKLLSFNNANNSSSSSSSNSSSNSKKIRYYMIQKNEYMRYKSMFNKNMKREPKDFVEQSI